MTISCPFCGTQWVDHALAVTGITLTDLERGRLLAALLTRPHLILSGPVGSGKCRLASALALAICQGRQHQVRLIQGHPWWAARTGQVARYVGMQSNLSAWRLADFIVSVLHRPQLAAGGGVYVAYVERMSPVEIELYFGRLALSLRQTSTNDGKPVPLRLIGTYDSQCKPDLAARILRTTALVHVGGAQDDQPGMHHAAEIFTSPGTGLVRTTGRDCHR